MTLQIWGKAFHLPQNRPKNVAGQDVQYLAKHRQELKQSAQEPITDHGEDAQSDFYRFHHREAQAFHIQANKASAKPQASKLPARVRKNLPQD